MRNSQLVIQSEEFSVIIVLLSDKLNAQRNYDISSQILKSGTSIGANIAEAVYAESTADFAHKFKIALKETNETENWLKLLYRAGKIDEITFNPIMDRCLSLKRMLISAVNTTKAKLENASRANYKYVA